MARTESKLARRDQVVDIDPETGVLASQTLALIDPTDKVTLARIEKANSLKDSLFDEEVDTFWKPQDASLNQSKVLKGLFLGWERGQNGGPRKYKVAIPHPKKKGAALIMSFNGNAMLTSKIDETMPGGEGPHPVRIEFLGKRTAKFAKDQDGNSVDYNEWSVRWGEVN